MRFLTKLTLLALVAGFTVGTAPAQAKDETRLAVTNQAEWPVFIYVDGQPFCYIDAKVDGKEDSCNAPIAPGSHKLEAVVGSDVIARKSITLKRGDTYLWTVRE